MADHEQEQNFRFLDITGWDAQQSDGAGVHWIKDYVEKEGGFEYSKLSAYQRYLFDALSRLRGRLSRRIPNDPLYIGTALMLTKGDRPHVAQGVRALQACGMLTFSNEQIVQPVKSASKKDANGTHTAPTRDANDTHTVPTQAIHGTHTVPTRHAHSSETLKNEQHDLQSRVEQNRADVDKNKADCTAIAAHGRDTISLTKLHTSKDDETKTLQHTVEAQTETAEEFAAIWMKLMPLNKNWKGNPPNAWKKLLTGDFEKLLAKYKPWQLHEILAFSQSPTQAHWNHQTKNLLDNGAIVEDRKNTCRKKKDGTWDKIISRYNAVVAGDESDEEAPSASGSTNDPVEDEEQEEAPPSLPIGWTWINEYAGLVECDLCHHRVYREKISEHEAGAIHKDKLRKTA